MGKFATAYKLLAEFRCKEAIDEFTKLPFRHYETGLVLSSIGRAYFEMSKYEDSVNFYEKSHRLEPYRVQGMEYYSTALWHLQKEVHLSCLSQKLIEFDKNAPETWCVAGNCFSLQKEHEVAIKFLNRAIQVDPEFSYAYTLLGHEFVSADDYDNALSCFRNATRIDKRHYNGWYGIGMINYKQEKYNYAYQHYKRALKISPLNPVLMCHLGITYHHIKQTEKALKLLDQAAKLDPTNALIRFHRSSIYFSIEKYPKALEELEQLKKIVPKEAMVYFLIGKVSIFVCFFNKHTNFFFGFLDSQIVRRHSSGIDELFLGYGSGSERCLESNQGAYRPTVRCGGRCGDSLYQRHD